MTGFRLPNLTQRLAVIGRTGSGKTTFSAWVLSRAGFDKQPFVIFDFKRDALLNAIEGARVIGYNEIPKHPGVYLLQPTPHEKDEMEAYLWKVWARERVGLYFDEMYSVPQPQRGGALQAVFTQGRSKKIPVIGCTQRPALVSRFLFTEADFFATFHLSTRPDQDRVTDFDEAYEATRLPKFSCKWYDVAEDFGCILSPVPGDDEILEAFARRLKPRTRHI